MVVSGRCNVTILNENTCNLSILLKISANSDTTQTLTPVFRHLKLRQSSEISYTGAPWTADSKNDIVT